MDNTDKQPTVPEENTDQQPTVPEDNTDKQPTVSEENIYNSRFKYDREKKEQQSVLQLAC